jgi:hypothetical protein
MAVRHFKGDFHILILTTSEQDMKTITDGMDMPSDLGQRWWHG